MYGNTGDVIFRGGHEKLHQVQDTSHIRPLEILIGNLIPGWVSTWPRKTSSSNYSSWVYCSPLVADVTGNGYLEVIVGADDLYIFETKTSSLQTYPNYTIHWGQEYSDAQRTGSCQ